MDYILPQTPVPTNLAPKTAALVASGDLRTGANITCWPAQQTLEKDAAAAFGKLGWKLKRAHTERLSDEEPHGFINSQAYGRKVFSTIHPDAPLVVAEAVWQYSHHVLLGLLRHRGPLLILANWSGKWPGLVGLLSLRAGLTKAQKEHSVLWGEDFESPEFLKKLQEWCDTGKINHDLSHVHRLNPTFLPEKEKALGEALAGHLKSQGAILGAFDEGCMGMFHAIMPDHLLNPMGVFKERLSQSTLYFEMTQVSDEEAEAVFGWLVERGMDFRFGSDEETELTKPQVLSQCKMYIAAARLADRFGCDAIGIQYQQGLKDLVPASDLAEGLLNCSERPPVKNAAGELIRNGQPITHFNEVDEGAGLDALITQRVWTAMKMVPDNTLHDIRWGDFDASGSCKDYVWVWEISGNVPASHFAGGYASACSERQPNMYFRLGGGTLKGISKPGEVVWSRIYIEQDCLHMDIGRCGVVDLPKSETERRWASTTPQWPIMHAVTYGVSRDQLMAKHQANHLQVVYADDENSADRALAVKAAMAHSLGIRVNLCGTAKDGTPMPNQLRKLGQ